MSQSIRSASTSPSKSATAAVLLSFLWPGLGQAYLGRRRPALAFAVPAFLLLLVLIWEARDGVELLLARVLLVPTAAAILVVTTVLLGVWRIASMSMAAMDPRAAAVRSTVRGGRSRSRDSQRRVASVLGFLVVLVIAMHGVIVWTGLAFLDAGSKIYVADGGGKDHPDDMGARPTPWVTPLPGGRINVLLIGADSGLGYTHSLTDTMILVSIDPTAKHVDMLSFPRDIARFPLYNGGLYGDKLNSLATYASQHPDKFPDGGIATLTREIAYLIGVPVHYYAFVDLAGFKAVVDAVDGVDIVNERDISDPGYQFPDHTTGFFLKAGPHHLDGRTALAYVRSRNGPGDNDFTRARRQQQVLVALRDRLTSPMMLPKLQTILQAFATTVQTDFPADGVPDLLKLGKEIPQDEVTHYVLGPPYAERPANSGGTYMLVIDEKKFAALSIRLFGSESRYTEAASSGSP